MIELVRKRHDGDGWIVFQELGDAPGIYRKRHADAVALGVWASKKYECHLYEFKISREDVKRELRDPKKAEGVGKYCHYWWLAISDEKIIADLVIPDAFGIVVRKKIGSGERLHVLRKAPRLDPKPFGPMFAISAIRNIRNGYIDPIDHQAVLEENHRLKHIPVSPEEYDREQKIFDLEREVEDLKRRAEQFEKASGVSLAERWQWGNIGEAVKVALTWREEIGDQGLRRDIQHLSKAAYELERRAHGAAEAAVALRSLTAAMDHDRHCSKRNFRGQCSCGVDPLSTVEKALAPEPDPAPASDEAAHPLHDVVTLSQ